MHMDLQLSSKTPVYGRYAPFCELLHYYLELWIETFTIVFSMCELYKPTLSDLSECLGMPCYYRKKTKFLPFLPYFSSYFNFDTVFHYLKDIKSKFIIRHRIAHGA